MAALRRLSGMTAIPPAAERGAPSHALVVAPADPASHALRIARGQLDDADERVALWTKEGARELLDLDADQAVATDLEGIARALAPEAMPEGEGHGRWLGRVRSLIEGAERMGHETDQARYEETFATWKGELEAVEGHLKEHRFLLGGEPTLADWLLFAFACRLDGVYATLFKAHAFLLEDLPALHGFARDLYEAPAVYAATDWEAILRGPFEAHVVANPRGIVPCGGRPELHAPHGRHRMVDDSGTDRAVEEDPDAARVEGEFVRGRSQFRHMVGEGDFPAEAGRYHLFAPYNCPWSHRALLGRAVKGLEAVVGASIVYFRRDPEGGWQMNPAIPGCDPDPIEGHRFVKAYYEAEGSDEKSVPILYDRKAGRIVNNESAEILRIMDGPLGDLGTRAIDLYPEAHRETIDRINETVYERINNGAYKAGFAKSQVAYDRAYARYFAAFRWVDERLADRAWLAGTDQPTEADLRLFPTIFRHDAVYWARFRLNGARVRDYPRLADWLERMLALPGVAEASNLDHARNGYFGRNGTEIVPAGPEPLGLSPKDYPSDLWRGRSRALE